MRPFARRGVPRRSAVFFKPARLTGDARKQPRSLPDGVSRRRAKRGALPAMQRVSCARMRGMCIAPRGP